MKWILLVLGIGLSRGVLLPDYRFEPNIILIPFCMPLLVAGVVAYLVAKKHLNWFVSISSGLASIYVSTVVGIIVYGFSIGWQYVTDDKESQGVFMATIGVQTITYVIGLCIFAYFVKRYSQSFQPTASSPVD